MHDVVSARTGIDHKEVADEVSGHARFAVRGVVVDPIGLWVVRGLSFVFLDRSLQHPREHLSRPQTSNRHRLRRKDLERTLELVHQDRVLDRFHVVCVTPLDGPLDEATDLQTALL